MTKHELAVIMAYTGVTTLVGEDFGIFHKYAEDLMRRPVYTHEFGIQLVADEIKKRSEPEFIKICQTATSNWISIKDKWRNFFKLRVDKAAHPQMREVTIPLLAELQRQIPIVFEGVNE